ncbi:hypothetical protein [Pelotalea chapellei]|uniref:Uncharacterized protein n=1 Tax=Pelotalea chapellei TaxID=44671 RepID=A0ABS5U5H5_9BACT|nr:hypothetical protein [Pelotalea chapellei]MBT1070921.1 hypothetical protein [Pelotalea chapellei]
MKKNIFVAALTMGILSVGALSASAAGSCCNDGTCADKQSVQKFTESTSALTSTLKAKDFELRELYGYDSINMRKISQLEAEIKELKAQIKMAAEKQGIHTCCLG